MELNDFKITVRRNFVPDATGYEWHIIILVEYNGELVDCEEKRFSKLETITGLNMEIKLMLDRLRVEFERIL
jgi:hypothetical protein